MTERKILHTNLILNSEQQKSTQGSVFYVKYKNGQSEEEEKHVESILKIVTLSFN